MYILPSPSRYTAGEIIPASCRRQVGSGVRFTADSRREEVWIKRLWLCLLYLSNNRFSGDWSVTLLRALNEVPQRCAL